MSAAPTRSRGPAGSANPAAADAQPEAAPTPFGDASPGARRLAASVLEVLAGSQTPSEAARSLGLSLARYYQLEQRALAGLVAACEPRRRGRSGEGLANLRRECDRLKRECARQQALARATRRAVGLAETPPAPPEGRAKGRKRRPTARALRAAALLRGAGGDAAPAASSAGGGEDTSPSKAADPS